MWFKDISYLELWRPLCLAEQNHLCNFVRGHHEEQICEIILNLDKLSFKDISYLKLWWPLCYAEQNHLCNFRRGHHKEHFCEIIKNLDQWFSR